jgi:hypothetical protein
MKNRVPGFLFVDFLGDTSKRRLTVSLLLAVLADRGWPLCPLFLSLTLPVSLNFSRRCLIVSLLGGFLPGKSLLNCRWVRTTDFVAKYASTIFSLSCIVYRVVGSIDALGWKSKALSMTYLKMRELPQTNGILWYIFKTRSFERCQHLFEKVFCYMQHATDSEPLFPCCVVW